MAIDVFAPIAILAVVARPETPIAIASIAAGMFGAALPDLLAVLSKFIPTKLLVFHQKIHLYYIHTKIFLDDRPVIGIGSQALIVAVMLYLTALFR